MGLDKSGLVRVVNAVLAVEGMVLQQGSYVGVPRTRTYCYAISPGGGIEEGIDPGSEKGWRKSEDCTGVEFRGTWQSTGQTIKVFNSTEDDVPGGIVMKVELWGGNEDGVLKGHPVAFYCKKS